MFTTRKSSAPSQFSVTLDDSHVAAGIEQDECGERKRNQCGAQHDEHVPDLMWRPWMERNGATKKTRVVAARYRKSGGDDVRAQRRHQNDEHRALEPQIHAQSRQR